MINAQNKQKGKYEDSFSQLQQQHEETKKFEHRNEGHEEKP